MSRPLAQMVIQEGPGFNCGRYHVIFVVDGLPLTQFLLRVGLTLPNNSHPLLHTQITPNPEEFYSPDHAAQYHIHCLEVGVFISARHFAGYDQIREVKVALCFTN
jgi:hypothetical protein